MDEMFLPCAVASSRGTRAVLNQSESLAVAYAVALNAGFRPSERGFVE